MLIFFFNIITTSTNTNSIDIIDKDFAIFIIENLLLLGVGAYFLYVRCGGKPPAGLSIGRSRTQPGATATACVCRRRRTSRRRRSGSSAGPAKAA